MTGPRSSALAEAHRNLAYAEGELGRFDEARTHLTEALALFDALGDRDGQGHGDQAVVLDHIGDTHHTLGDHSRARQAWREALTILTELDVPEAEDVRAKLHSP